MNILFANYGDYTANSLNHIGLFAAELRRQGHECVVAVPDKPETLRALPKPEFIPATFAELLAKPAFFSDGRMADILHAWTPREGVRRFALAYRAVSACRLVIHLEDNEEHLAEANLGRPIGELRSAAGLGACEALPESLSHPARFPFLLRCADAATVIVPTLRRFVPVGTPCEELPPGVDFSFHAPQRPDPALRAQLGLTEGERVIVFTGSNTFANEEEIRALYEAVALLNEQGLPTRLLRTGLYSGAFHRPLGERLTRHVLDLGFVERTRLPGLLALSDVCVQPGLPGPFNDFRLPSKIPELLAMGLPLVLPASNVGLQLRHLEQAWILPRADAEGIAAACSALFRDPALAARLGAAGAVYAREHYDLARNAGRLLALYQAVLAAPLRAPEGPADELVLTLRAIASRLHRGADVAALAELEPLLTHLQEVQSAHLSLRPRHAALEHAHALLRDRASDLTRSLDNATQRLLLTHQHVSNLEDIIAELKRVQEGLQLRLTESERDARVTITGLISQQSETSERLAALEAKLRRMQASFSWKLTAPLRSLRRLLKGR
jgi:glycosyltransferase involved in cell wall biosynthesis